MSWPANSYQTASARWQALTKRDPHSHASFLYGVKSTKIYCRPTCSARLARRANVVFYDHERQALVDGFRPCKRCKPDDRSFAGEHEQLVSRVLGILRASPRADAMRCGLKDLAHQVDVSPSYLCRVFKKTMGMTLGAYMKEFDRPVDQIGFLPLSNSASIADEKEVATFTPSESLDASLTCALAELQREPKFSVPIDTYKWPELDTRGYIDFDAAVCQDLDFDAWAVGPELALMDWSLPFDTLNEGCI